MQQDVALILAPSPQAQPQLVMSDSEAQQRVEAILTPERRIEREHSLSLKLEM